MGFIEGTTSLLHEAFIYVEMSGFCSFPYLFRLLDGNSGIILEQIESSASLRTIISSENSLK